MINLPEILRIKTMQMSDIEVVLKIQTENNLSFWAFDDYVRQISEFNSVNIVAALNNETVGFIISSLIISTTLLFKNELEILNFSVRKDFQNSGIGTALIKNLVVKSIANCVESIWLEVRENNKKAQSFYENHGFTRAYQRKNYYRNPVEDAVIMRLILDSI
jgi:ribosomal-protein-alanine N-acetyltransferase